MKIIVLHKDGRQEVLTLADPIHVYRGVALNRLVTSTGMEHFFDQEGYYDGWGRGVALARLGQDDAPTFASKIDNDREFISKVEPEL